MTYSSSFFLKLFITLCCWLLSYAVDQLTYIFFLQVSGFDIDFHDDYVMDVDFLHLTYLTLLRLSLGNHHVGYRRQDFPSLNVSIVGCRPFSCGGKRIFRENLLSQRLILEILIQFIFNYGNPLIFQPHVFFFFHSNRFLCQNNQILWSILQCDNH